ncbi:CLC4M-like protein [Mya arenaria]|uniref:CLC4M-like protein n=2 Tax=Mya arenaria TaxID=6604 RepID=A0ABY7F728_MYAAR|nr:CLC4M-like protein [Mya arenaria]
MDLWLHSLRSSDKRILNKLLCFNEFAQLVVKAAYISHILLRQRAAFSLKQTVERRCSVLIDDCNIYRDLCLIEMDFIQICILLLQLVANALGSVSTKAYKRHNGTSTLKGKPLELSTAPSAVQCLTLCAGYQHTSSEVCYAARYNSGTGACELISRDRLGTVEWMSANEWKVYVNKDAGCEEGWHSYESSCYFLSTEELNWHDARNSCLNLGATLAVVTDEDEDEFVWKLIQTLEHKFAWLGASDKDLEGSWRWVTGAEWNFTLWLNDYVGDNQNNCLLRSSSGWGDYPCDSDLHAYVCE